MSEFSSFLSILVSGSAKTREQYQDRQIADLKQQIKELKNKNNYLINVAEKKQVQNR